MHPHMERLYIAAKELAKADGQSAVAKLLNVSPQRVNNWEARGMSSEGLLEAQRVIGCNAIWIRDGEGSMKLGASQYDLILTTRAEVPATELAYVTIIECKILTAYRKGDVRQRAEIEFAAGLLEHGSRQVDAANGAH